MVKWCFFLHPKTRSIRWEKNSRVCHNQSPETVAPLKNRVESWNPKNHHQGTNPCYLSIFRVAWFSHVTRLVLMVDPRGSIRKKNDSKLLGFGPAFNSCKNFRNHFQTWCASKIKPKARHCAWPSSCHGFFGRPWLCGRQPGRWWEEPAMRGVQAKLCPPWSNLTSSKVQEMHKCLAIPNVRGDLRRSDVDALGPVPLWFWSKHLPKTREIQIKSNTCGGRCPIEECLFNGVITPCNWRNKRVKIEL